MEYFKSQLDSLNNQWTHEPEKMMHLRNSALEQFLQMGLPNKHWEDWQFTDFSPFDKTKFRISSADDVKDIDKYHTQSFTDSFSIIILNGHYQPQLSHVPNGVTIRTLFDVFIKDEKAENKIEQHLANAYFWYELTLKNAKNNEEKCGIQIYSENTQ